MVEWTLVASGLQFPEGPVALADGGVLVVEIRSGALTRVERDGTLKRIAQCGGGPNGAALGPDGRIYVCNNGGFEWAEMHGLTIPLGRPADYIGGRIQTVDAQTGEVKDLYVACDGAPLRGPNDLVFDRHGGFYFTDTGKHDHDVNEFGALYYARADGSMIKRLAAGLGQPNGCGLSPDGRRLYFTETQTARVWSFEVDAPGVVRGGATPFGIGGADFRFGTSRYELFDSMAVEADGGLCVATLFSGGVTLVGKDDSPRGFIPGPAGEPGVTNLCFSPLDPHLAYLTASCTGALYCGRWPRPGLVAAYV